MNRTKSLKSTDSRTAHKVHPTNGRRQNGAAGSQSPPDDENKLLQLVPEGGSSVGNKWLRERLTWEPARYFQIRDRLVERKVLSTGRGRGGSVYRLRPISGPKLREEATPPGGRRYRKEADLYSPIAEALRDGLSKTLDHQRFLVQSTGKQGRKATGGMWTRPDITVVTVDTYAFVPGKSIEVITYEVKPAGNWNVAGVFEAASQSRFATQTHLLIYAPEGHQAVPDEQLERLRQECVRFGIGLGFCQDPRSYDTYDFLVDPERRQPNPADMNRFITQQLTEANKNLIAEWLR